MTSTLSASVIIPAYNAEIYIRKTLKSVLSNRLVAEVIVVDDCSTDATAAIVAGYGAADSRVRLVARDRNQGAGAARNAGLREASAGYCFFLDADDYIADKGLDEAVGVLHARQADFLLYKWYYTDAAGKVGAVRMLEYDEMRWDAAMAAEGGGTIVRTDAYKHPELTRTLNFPWNKVYRRSFLLEKKIRFSETFVHNDNLAHWMSYASADSFILYNRYIIGHREDTARSSLTMVRDERRLQLFDVFDEVDAFFLHAAPRERQLHPYFTCYKRDMCNWNSGHVHEGVLPLFIEKAGKTFANLDSDAFFRCCVVDAPAAKDIYDIKFAPIRYFAARRARAR